MTVNQIARLIALLVAFWSVGAITAVEPGADAKLPTSAGLELWLDAGREAAARAAAGQTQFQSGDRLAEWHDASGGKRHGVQADRNKQPKVVRVASNPTNPDAESGWVVRFDGEDDHLRVLGMNRRFTEFTLFVVAAPHSTAGSTGASFPSTRREKRTSKRASTWT